MSDVSTHQPTDHHAHLLHGSGARARNQDDALFLARYEHRMRIPILLSAVLPLIISPQPGNPLGVVVGVASWVVFLIDFIIHMRRLDGYLHTWLGKLDLTVVVLTSPWYLLPGANAGGFIVVLRLARLARVLVSAKGARRLFARLGRVALVAALVLVVASGVAFRVESPVNPEFASFGDALWWGYVTLTTVGYGDIVPVTDIGRWMSVFIMTTGVATLGVLAGSLASFFRLTPAEAQEDAEDARRAQEYFGEADDAEEVLSDDADEAQDISLLTAQIALLTDEVRRLGEQVATLAGGASPPTATRTAAGAGTGTAATESDPGSTRGT